jgi:hypothetical protein
MLSLTLNPDEEPSGFPPRRKLVPSPEDDADRARQAMAAWKLCHRFNVHQVGFGIVGPEPSGALDYDPCRDRDCQ